jgi:hypothetical protein
MEWVMSLNLKKVLGAGLLTFAVVGGAMGYLNSTLHVTPAQLAVENTQIAQPGHTPVVTVTEGRAS